MKKYRRVEINAYRRRVTIVSGISGDWSRENIDAHPAETDDEISLNNTDSCEPVEPESPEGQLIIVEAVRSLERRLSPETRATISAGQGKFVLNRSTLKRFYCKLRSFFQPKDLDLSRNQNSAAKQSVED